MKVRSHAANIAKRRNRLMGEWAAAALRLSGNQAKGYADNLFMLGDSSSEDAQILNKVDTDFVAASILDFRQIVRFKMQSLFEAAQYQLREEANGCADPQAASC